MLVLRLMMVILASVNHLHSLSAAWANYATLELETEMGEVSSN
jgi:hypothetical protein